MWRRGATRLEALVASALKQRASVPHRCGGHCCSRASSSFLHSYAAPFSKTAPLSAQSGDGEKLLKKEKQVEAIMPIATGLEREELEFELEGKLRFDLNPPSGPFGTKEAPAIVESYFDKRIVGCPGGAGEEEHDVIWFWLEKDKSFECPVCSQFFQLKVIGPGGPPGGHHH
uniref:Uncharacterized protein n=1 Tax=Picea sitchensis TaxID=3332 RepID=A9NSR3_PICSI|nr:unknown [Picea sitchensis]